jgi:hypothetical protein
MRLKYLVLWVDQINTIEHHSRRKGDIVDVCFGHQGPLVPVIDRFVHIFVDGVVPELDVEHVKVQRTFLANVARVLLNDSVMVTEPLGVLTEDQFEETNGYPATHAKRWRDWAFDFDGSLSALPAESIANLEANHMLRFPSIEAVLPHVISKETGLALTVEDFA